MFTWFINKKSKKKAKNNKIKSSPEKHQNPN